MEEIDADMTCRGYEIGKTYEMDGEPEFCRKGFHFYRTVSDVFKHDNN